MKEFKLIEITEEKIWSARNVREACIKHNLYTEGSCREYDKMLDFVRENDFTPMNLFLVAEDICNHSEGQKITNVMFLINKEAVRTYYYIDKKDTI